MSWGSTSSGRVSGRVSRRPLNESEADEVMHAARVIYESLSDAQMARLKAGRGEHLKIRASAARALIEAVEGPYIDEEVGGDE